jgi:polysaccharide export outer membrane protein
VSVQAFVIRPRPAGARVVWLGLLLWAVLAPAADTATEVEDYAHDYDVYRIQPGDILSISVWKEPDLQAEVLVRSDGAISFPLAGDTVVAHFTVDQVREDLTRRLQKYIPEPVVTVAIKQMTGNRVYVVGKVNRPGEFVYTKPLDVMQAISLAGGTTPYAALDAIKILRRVGVQTTSIPFSYSDVVQGRSLDQNIVLWSGDTVVVP